MERSRLGFAASLDCRVILPMIETERLEGVPGRYWHRLGDGRIQCDVCPRLCKLHQGQRGLCFVRGRQDDQIVLTTYGRSSGFCLIRSRRSRSTITCQARRCCRSAPPAAI